MPPKTVEDIINKHYNGDKNKFFEDYENKIKNIMSEILGKGHTNTAYYVEELKNVQLKIHNRELPSMEDLIRMERAGNNCGFK